MVEGLKMLKEILVSAALAIGQTPSVIDGDTVRLAGVSIRLIDYDSPELFSPKCPKERQVALQARRELQALLTLAEAGAVRMTYKLTPCAYANNYGRLCAEATIDGKPLAAHMIKLGFASPYVCEPGRCPKKVDWCRPAAPSSPVWPSVVK
jgi:endonuclease YncB( thermonuclease family)